MNAGRVNANEYVVSANFRPIDLLEAQDVAGVLALLVLHDGPHRGVRCDLTLCVSSWG
jgi:hypothetical protein